MSNFKILVVEDEVFIAEDIHSSLLDLGYDVCDIAYDSETALKKIHQHSPDLILLDITIRGQNDGIYVAQIIHENHQIPFIFLTSHSDRNTLERAKKTRPYGYIVKPFKDKDLISSIEIALFNWSEELKKRNLEISVINKVASPPLSEKEYEVYLDLVDGLNNNQIAKKHFVSVNTVKTHIKRIFTKLDVHDRLSALKKVIN